MKKQTAVDLETSRLNNWLNSFKTNSAKLTKDQVERFINFIHFKVSKKEQFLTQLETVLKSEDPSQAFQQADATLKNEAYQDLSDQELRVKVESLQLDNECYENTIFRLRGDNQVVKERLIEVRRMVDRYEYQAGKWNDVCRESEITKGGLHQRVVNMNHSLNLEKKDQLHKIHVRKLHLLNLDQQISDYKKDIEDLKEQESEALSRVNDLKERLGYLKQRSAQFRRKRYNTKEKLRTLERRYLVLHETVSQQDGQLELKTIDSKHLAKFIQNEVNPRIIMKGSLENQARDLMLKIYKLRFDKRAVRQELEKLAQGKTEPQEEAFKLQVRDINDQITNWKNQKEQDFEKSRKLRIKVNLFHSVLLVIKENIQKTLRKDDQMFYSHLLNGDSEFERKDRIASIVPIIERTIVGIMDLTSLRLPRIDPNLTYAQLLPEREKMVIKVFDVSGTVTPVPNHDHRLDSIRVRAYQIEDELVQDETDSIRQITFYFGLSLSSKSLAELYKTYFESLVHQNEKSESLAVKALQKRRKTLRSLGIEMVQKQADILIQSKKSDNFDIYFHSQRQTVKVKKDLQVQMDELKKIQDRNKLQENFKEAMRLKIERMMMKEIQKQEMEAHNLEKMNEQLKKLFQESNHINNNEYIKNKWEAQNMFKYRNVEKKYRNLRVKLDKNNLIDFTHGNLDTGLSLEAQRLKHNQYYSKINENRSPIKEIVKQKKKAKSPKKESQQQSVKTNKNKELKSQRSSSQVDVLQFVSTREILSPKLSLKQRSSLIDFNSTNSSQALIPSRNQTQSKKFLSKDQVQSLKTQWGKEQEKEVISSKNSVFEVLEKISETSDLYFSKVQSSKISGKALNLPSINTQSSSKIRDSRIPILQSSHNRQSSDVLKIDMTSTWGQPYKMNVQLPGSLTSRIPGLDQTHQAKSKGSLLYKVMTKQAPSKISWLLQSKTNTLENVSAKELDE